MFCVLAVVIIWIQSIHATNGKSCPNKCPQDETEIVCGFDVKRTQYKMFPSKCALEAYAECYQVDLTQTPIKYCIKDQQTISRRVYGESCPVFCSNYYRPVCGASNIRFYAYRTFNNGCYLDMINCRGDDDSGYTEVPLEFCQRHMMKNIFKEQIVVSNLQDYHPSF